MAEPPSRPAWSIELWNVEQECNCNWVKRSLEVEQRARKDLEKVVRRVLKSMNDPTWDETNL